MAMHWQGRSQDRPLRITAPRHVSLAVWPSRRSATPPDRPWTLAASRAPHDHRPAVAEDAPAHRRRARTVPRRPWRPDPERPAPAAAADPRLRLRHAQAAEPFLPVRDGRVASLAGYFHHDGESTTSRSRSKATTRARPVVFHEYTHLLVRNAARSIPVWLNEGLAEYYSTYALEAGGTRAHIGRPIAHHVALLRERFMPLSQLIAVDTASALYNEGERRSIFYAEAWALTHYLMVEMPKGRPPSTPTPPASRGASRQTRVSRRRSERAGRLRAGSCGDTCSVPTFRSTVFAFPQRVTRGRARAGRGCRPVTPAPGWATSSAGSDGAQEAAPRIEAAVAAAPSASMPATRARPAPAGRRSATDEAWPAFERAVAAAPGDFFAQYAYGVSRLRHQAAAADQSGRRPRSTARARRWRRAAAINPSSSDAFAWLAYAEMLSDNRLGEARAAIARAIDLAPGRVDTGCATRTSASSRGISPRRAPC